MKITSILLSALVVITLGLTFNQWRLQRVVEQLLAKQALPSGSADGTEDATNADAKLRDAERRFNEARVQMELAQQQLAAANQQLAQLDSRRQLEGRRSRPIATENSPRAATTDTDGLEGDIANPIKRSWGPEQAAGPPDTFTAGDIRTAWASLEQDAGEEWLKLDYERAVDIAEVRVRETHNPGAIAKVTAFLANGTEVTLWEGTEPPSQAPVEMSFQVPSKTIARSVKVYLDSKRVPGWNEIDAVAIIGRDGATQWASHVTASSTFAQFRVASGTERF
jgi:hypothetical protein